MDKQTMVVAVMGQLIGLTIVLSIIMAWVKTRSPGKGQGPSSEAVQRLSAQIEQLQGSLDAVALEVERISEGQRFTTKLLSERGATVRPGLGDG
ncbi:MAG: hypothetical protein HYX65_02800 [Gemmatimonadetes bacterium]|nr:hypothetical protein [Gemmatimonadota bacterium]